VVLSSGPADNGPASVALEEQLRKQLQHSSMRILGLNSSGVVCPHTGFNATFAPSLVRRGNIGILCQGDELLMAFLADGHPEHIGCSAFISVGSGLDIRWADWIDYLARDPRTQCIGLFLEKLSDPRSFFRAVREVAGRKPVLLVKGGEHKTKSPGLSKDDVFDEACRANGVLRVRRIKDLFRMADLLTTQPAARGRRLTVVTNTHGPGVLATDMLRAAGGRLAALEPATATPLRRVLPPGWNAQNPIEIGEDADAERFTSTIAIANRDPASDALFVLLSPQAALDPIKAAEGLKAVAQQREKPILACWLWGAASSRSLSILRAAGIPVFSSAESAVSAFDYLWRHAENLRCLADLNAALAENESAEDASNSPAPGIVQARRHERTILTLAECQQLFSAYGMRVLESRRVCGENEAIQEADSLLYPILLSLTFEPWLSEGNQIHLTVGNTSAVGKAVRTLNLVAREQWGATEPVPVLIEPLLAAERCEIAVHAVADPDLGPIIEFGETSQPATGPRHTITAIPPLTPLTVREWIEDSPGLKVYRERAEDLQALEDFLLNFSRLLVEQPSIKEITMRLLVASAERVVIRNAAVVLHEK
jgi:acetyltransferase